MWQGAYTAEGWATLIEKPENRIQAVRPAIERLGGKIRNAFFSFGEYDVILIIEMPDNVSAAALSMAIASGGVVKSARTTVLMSPDDGLAAIKKASSAGYRPPKPK
jgi:uncharacterized protein with GYD domain